MAGLAFDDLTVGRSWQGASRTVTEADVGAFAGLTGDYFPLHTSEEYAKQTQFGTRIAHGLLGLSFAQGLMWVRTGELDDSIVAFLGVEWSFDGPIHFGDTIDVVYEVVEQRLSRSAPDRGVVTFAVSIRNQRGETVQHGRKTLLVLR